MHLIDNRYYKQIIVNVCKNHRIPPCFCLSRFFDLKFSFTEFIVK